MAAIQKVGHTVKDARILECSCSHAYQDKKYGIGRRVHNPTKNGYKCTVCGKATKWKIVRIILN